MTMKIKITSRFKPLTHSFGVPLILPGSPFALKIYPQQLLIEDLRRCTEIGRLKNHLKGPIKDFTVLQNLDQGAIEVWGFTPQGYFGYRIKALEACQGMVISPLSQAKEPLDWEATGEWNAAVEQKNCFFSRDPSFRKTVEATNEREILHLGNNKQQDWDLIQRRSDLTEILPIWYLLGQWSPEERMGEQPSLFSLCAASIESGHHDRIASRFTDLYQAAFTGMLCPQLWDTHYQGFALPPIDAESPLALLSEGTQLIRRLFVRQNGPEVALLPALPPQFHCGRMKNVKLPGIGTCDLEWTKKTIRRLVLRASENVEIFLKVQSQVHQYRMRTKEGLCGVVCNASDRLPLKAGYTYLMDHF